MPYEAEIDRALDSIGRTPMGPYSGPAIKGAYPARDYNFTLGGIYSDLGPLPENTGMSWLSEALSSARSIAGVQAGISAAGAAELGSLDEVLLDLSRCGLAEVPTDCQIYGIPPRMSALPAARPYRFGQSDSEIVPNALKWADSNLKLACEQADRLLVIEEAQFESFVEMVLRGFSLILRMGHDRLVGLLGYNTSAFVQERLMHLVLGQGISKIWAERERKGNLANGRMLAALRTLDKQPFDRLLRLSLISGSIRQVRLLFDMETHMAPNSLAACLIAGADELEFAASDIGGFESWIRRQSRGGDQRRICLLLDDNGEAATDLFFVQELLRCADDLQLAIVVNQFPMSANVSLRTLMELVRDELFVDLRSWLSSGRVVIKVEQHLFHVLEPPLLTPQSLAAIRKADVTYLKGVGLFEVFGQIESIARYHALVVEGKSSNSVTGWRSGSALFVEVAKGRRGYHVFDSGEVVPLKHERQTFGSSDKGPPE